MVGVLICIRVHVCLLLWADVRMPMYVQWLASYNHDIRLPLPIDSVTYMPETGEAELPRRAA